jgi:type IV pilus assembly protein PilF
MPIFMRPWVCSMSGSARTRKPTRSTARRCRCNRTIRRCSTTTRYICAAANPLYRSPWAAYTNAGVCLRQAHREDEAAQLFVRALRSNPAYSEAIYQASDLDLTQQKYAAARLRIDFFLTNNAATPDLLLLGWRIAQAQNDAPGAARYAQRLAKEFPSSDQSRSLAASQANPG